MSIRDFLKGIKKNERPQTSMLFVLILSKGSPKTDNYAILSFQTKFDNKSEWGQKTKSTIKRSQRFPQIRIWQLTINDNIYIRENQLQNHAKLPVLSFTQTKSFSCTAPHRLISALWRHMNLSWAFSDYELRTNESEFAWEKERNSRLRKCHLESAANLQDLIAFINTPLKECKPRV